MAEFVQTMKDWRRMCKAQDDGSDRDVCATCPFGMLGEGCSSIYENDMDYAKLESVVTKWAAEHPEPVYPTWGEWFVQTGDLPQNYGTAEFGLRMAQLLKVMATPIPADIAEKLGIEPKEG